MRALPNVVILRYSEDLIIFWCLPSQSLKGTLSQNDMNALATWSKNWEMKLNIAKYCILHYGRTIKNICKIHVHNAQIVCRDYDEDLKILFSNKHLGY